MSYLTQNKYEQNLNQQNPSLYERLKYSSSNSYTVSKKKKKI